MLPGFALGSNCELNRDSPIWPAMDPASSIPPTMLRSSSLPQEQRQGKRLVADDSMDFQTRASHSGWNMSAQVSAFVHGLADK